MLFISDKSMGVGRRISSNFYSAMGGGGEGWNQQAVKQYSTDHSKSKILQVPS